MMMVGNKRRQGLTKFEDSIMTGGEFKNNAVFNASAGNVASGASTEGSMLLTDFSRLGMGAIDSHEVDPIAEAEVYMAYGRDAQAEEILREALTKDPSRHEIALKLLELYASRKDTSGFETTASELYAGMGGQNTPVWQRAAEMGRSIDPQNPLYRLSSPQTAPMAAPAAAMAATAAVAAAVSEPAAAAQAPVELGDLEQLASMNDWGDTQKVSGNDLEFSTPPGTDWDVQSVQPAVALEPADDMLVAPVDDNLMEFESATPFAEPSLLPSSPESEFKVPEPEFNAPEFESAPEAVELDLEIDDLDLAPEHPVAPAALLDEALDLDFPAEPESAAPDAMPVLDLSGIDLDLEVEDLSAVEPPSAPAVEEAEAIVAQPILETATDFDPFADLSAPEDIRPASDLQPEHGLVLAASTLETEAESKVEAEAGVDSELHEEVNTKLDLARAYLEMGDREGAREILQEVLGEGDAQQKAEADKLLADAG